MSKSLLPRPQTPHTTALVRVLVVALLICVLLGIGAIGFHWIEGWTWFDSFYCTLMTISTIGAEPVSQLSATGRAFNVILVILGVGVVGFAVASFTQAVIESEFSARFGRRRIEKEISKLKDHFIICGVGRVGRRVAEEIVSAHLPLVVIERDADNARWAQERGLLVLVGDATAEETLRRAGIDRARGLASAVTSDAGNVYVVLTARGIAPNLPIVARASEEHAEAKLLRAGATTVISPYRYAGLRMARVLTRPNVQRFIDLALSSFDGSNLDLAIHEIPVAQRSSLCGAAFGDIQARKNLGVILLGIRQQNGKLVFNPAPEHSIGAGDALITMGDVNKLKELEVLAG